MAADTLSKLGKYEIRGMLGKGAMGIVYDGFDPVIQRRVAIKTVAKQSLDPSESAKLLDRFKREAQAAGRLNHPGIVSIHEYGEDDGVAFIAMEFVRGHELRTYFESQQRFPLAHIVLIMCDILDALDHAHRNGVVHRDIKPANIMITDEGRVKVADFGVARIESSMMTQVGTRIGTPAYMSPEQHQGLPVDGRSDLFSAGVILYEFLTGERPFTGDGYTLIQQILLQDATRPSAINRDIPRRLDAVAMQALARRPEDRFATAHEFAEAFRAAAMGESFGPGVDFVLNDRTLPLSSQGVMTLAGSWQETNAAGASVVSSSGPTEVSLEAELEYWKEIKDSTDASDFSTFLQVFPESRFAPLARRRMNRLEGEVKTRRDAGEQEAAERACIDGKQAVEGAEEETHRNDPERQRGEDETRARGLAEEQCQREDEEARLLAEADSRRSAEESARKETAAEPLPHEAEARKRAQTRAQRKRDVDWRLRRLDADEPTLRLRPACEGNDLMPPMDLSPRIVEQPVSGADGHPHFRTATGSVDATAPTHAQTVPVRARSFTSIAPRKRRRLPIAAVLAAVLVCSGVWYANRPELALIVTKLRMEIPAILEQLQQPGQAREVGQERKGSDAARQSEEPRKNEEALNSERNRQQTLARQKEEAARAGAMQNYQRAMALLDQGRTSEAVRLLRRLAYDGHGAAAKALGDLYSSGEKVLLDRQEASHFYAIAERNGVKIDRSVSGRR